MERYRIRNLWIEESNIIGKNHQANPAQNKSFQTLQKTFLFETQAVKGKYINIHLARLHTAKAIR